MKMILTTVLLTLSIVNANATEISVCSAFCGSHTIKEAGKAEVENKVMFNITSVGTSKDEAFSKLEKKCKVAGNELLLDGGLRVEKAYVKSKNDYSAGPDTFPKHSVHVSSPDFDKNMICDSL